MDPFEKDGIKYAEYGDDGVKITYFKSNNIPTSVTWHGKTRTVKYIDSGAIRGDFTSITIPNGIKLAGDAFGNCHKLNSISSSVH